MQGSVTRMAGLIDNVLDFARGRLGGGIGLVRETNAPLEPVLIQVVEELRAGAPERTILTEYSLTEPVSCDRSRIGQLVSNLLGKALTHGAADKPVRLQAFTIAGVLEISVANGGLPISEKARLNLFQPFFRGEVRGSQQGLGLGLHIASEIAKAHDGGITVVSDQTETRFTFRMPTAAP
ncbi:HAMP domain-containing histidine kinase [Agrobacterium rhizogenes]|nr:HAMP domain-containing histidine kinase [Rhizobium rhizogenes]